MQPPPRTGPPGASGPPPSGPNMFRRTRPHKHPAAATMPPVTQPMTDPFAFVRAPPPMAAGGLPSVPNNGPPQLQAAPSTAYSQPSTGPLPHSHPPEVSQVGLPGPSLTPSSSFPGLTLFSPHGTTSPSFAPAPVPAGYASYSLGEQAYFNSKEQTPSTASEPPHMASGPVPSQTPSNQEFHGQPPPQPVPFQPVPPQNSSAPWPSDHGSRPPSVQNYFQPTNDPPQQSFNLPAQNQMYPSSQQSTVPPHQPNPATTPQPGHPQDQAPPPFQNPVNTPNSQWPDPNVPQHHNSHFQMQGYFTQSSTPHDSWFNQPPSDSGYHQMATSSDHPQSRPDSASSHHLSNAGAGANSGPALVPYSQESGSLSMFFNDNDVENEETLAGEKNRAVNGGLGSFHHHSHPQPHTSHGDGPLDYQAPPLQDHSQIPYMNDGNSSSHGVAPKPLNSHDEHVENLECVPNQEVLPSEALGNAAAAAVAAVDQFETGPNLETPDSIPRPMRSASVSSNYSNMSHGSGTASRRHQGVMGTFIQQESPRLTDEAHLPLTTGGYFEQIDTSPAGDVAAQQSSQEQTWPSTPSPPKPTGIFQASANSSFEPVRSHGVGVRPPEVDRAKVVAEGGADSTPGNLEQPPDNMENIYSPGHPLPAGVGVVPHLTHPVVHSHSRPSSRAFGASRPCESPATTLWAQNDPTGLAANILLAPAAPTVLAPLREPSADVIQPPEDGPLDLQPAHRAQPSSQQHLENLENPPKVSEVEPADPQGNLGYASLLVPDSLQQPVLIAPPVSSYSVITPSTSALESSQTSAPESVSNPSARPITQGPKSASVASSQNPLFAPGPINFTSSASHQNPLNLTHDKSDVKSDTVAPSQPQQVRPPLARGQSQSGDSHSSLQVHPQASVVTTAASNQPSNYELLDFSMHQSQNQIQASGHPSSLHESSQSANGFYLQVTKDAQHGMNVKGNPPAQTAAPLTNTQPAPTTASHATASALPPVEPQKTPDPSLKAQTLNVAPAVPVSAAPTSHSQYPAPAPASAAPPFSAYPPGPPGPAPPGTAQPAPADPPRPPSSAGSQHGSQHGSLHGSLHGSQHGSQHGHGPSYPPPGQMYGGYYGYYGEYNDGRAAYPPGQYAPFSGDPRYKYYQDGFYRGQNDPWYGRYKGQPGAYRDPNYTYREPPPERPSSRASQYSDRPSSRQGYPEDFHRANQSAYSDHYVDYPKPYDYSGYNYGQYDPRYKAYYDSYWSNHDGSYTGRDYYNSSMYPPRNEDYDNQWQYYPGYDTSFDDDRRRPRDVCADDFDRRSVRSEHSARSVQSSHSHHSRQSSFSSQSQQSQVYRNQADPVSAAYDTTVSTLAAEYSYGPYPHQTDTSQNYYYPSEYNADNTWNAPEQPPPRPATPEKFTVPHRCARFGPGGHLIQVLPNLPSDGQPALVDIHSMETILQDSPDQAELRGFPGPLVKEETHKVDVIKFSQSKAVECSRDNDLLDRDSARLLWDFIMLLCRQNGTVVGTDIADLLLKEHRSVWLPGKSPNEANLIDFNNEPLARAEEEPGAGPLSLLSDTFMTVPENVGKETERFRELLLFGRKKDALEAAMKGGLWGHALLLASKMDNRTHARVMIRFANSLPINDPLQTVYQLMSGRMPASATCCGEEKWGDWRPHLAMVLSNLTHSQDLDTRTISTMGDTLASKGLIDAAHFCYLMAQVGLGVYTKKSTKMVLIGSNHSLPFFHFATNEAIQRTEAYEYAQSLGSQPCSLPNFQVFKLIYACRLAEAGLSAQAFHYCEVISRTVLQQPAYYSPIFISQIIQMSEKLRFFDPQLKEKPEKELFDEPEWLIHLRQLDGQIKMGQIKYNEDRRTPTQFECSTPSSDMDESSPAEPYNMPVELDGPAPDNPLMSSLLPGPPPQGVQLMPPAPTSILQDGMPPPQIPHEVPQFYPVPPSGPPGQVPISGYPPQDPGFAPPPFQPQQEQLETYPAPQQPGPPAHQPGQMSPHMPPQVPHSPVQMNPPLYHVPQHAPQHMPPSPGHMPHTEHLPLSTPEMSSSPPRGSFTPQKDFYDQMAHMGPGRRSRTTSQSSLTHMAPGRRSRTTSESSTHSGGRERSNSTIKQTSPPPPSIPEQPRKEEQQKKERRDSPKKSRVGGWIKNWWWKGKNEAHLPADDKPSIVWDEQKQKWVDLNEPEEESKPLAPPPSGFPSMPQMPRPGVPGGPPGGGPPVNMFSRKAGPRSRYVDVLNPGGTTKPGGLAPAPADIFAPLAPMPMPANLFVPSSAPDDQQPLEGSEGGNREQNSPNASAAPQTFNPTLVPPAPEVPAVPDGSQSGENHPGQGAPPTGGVTFYNPAQFAQTSAPSGGGHRTGRLGGQRQYPVLK